MIKPQEGPQEAFLASEADITIYGGAAGGGKTWGLLAEPLRHIDNPHFNAVIFRRNAVQVRNEGGLWDASMRIYPIFGANPRGQMLEWTFPSGAVVRFAHLENENTVLSYQGAEIVLLGFDELTHFSQGQFFYMLSRNRTTCGVRPYVRATCNADSGSWVARLVEWWVDQSTGLAIPERSGILRWMVRINDEIRWGDTRQEMLDRFGADCEPKSFTFISSSLFDNQILVRADPGYLANLKALPKVDRERLLYGNWKISPSAGNAFRREWVDVIDAAELPPALTKVRGWDLAATPVTTESPDPDFTVGVLMGRDRENGHIYVIDGRSLRATAGGVEDAVANTAAQDGRDTIVSMPQDPGQAGKSQCLVYAKRLLRYRLRTSLESGDKETRFGPFSSACEHGNVTFVRGGWNAEFFDILEQFPTPGIHDDHADACSRAYNELLEERSPMRINPLALNRPFMMRR